MPISSARSVGTFRVRSPWVIRRTKYLFLAPSGIVMLSVPSITAAPWWGYTTLSPTLKGTRSLLLADPGPLGGVPGCHLQTGSPQSPPDPRPVSDRWRRGGLPRRGGRVHHPRRRADPIA